VTFLSPVAVAAICNRRGVSENLAPLTAMIVEPGAIKVVAKHVMNAPAEVVVPAATMRPTATGALTNVNARRCSALN
jgi:hypothetical protein